MIYLDNNASTPVDPEVSDAVCSCLRTEFGNPSSIHEIGRKAHGLVDSCRKTIADFLECLPEEIFFTSGGTESNNLAILGTAAHYGAGHIITSSIEHPSVLNICRHLEMKGFSVSVAGTGSNGLIDISELKNMIRKDTILISVMHANNETGVIQPVEEISCLSREHSIAFHVDAAQTIGKVPFTVKDSGIDMLTVVSHKFYGPKGVGALYVRKGTNLSPILFGAGHELGLRPGTENLPGIVGLATACLIARRDIAERVAHARRLRDLLFTLLKAAIPEIKLNGHASPRLPNTLNLILPGVLSHELVKGLGNKVAISSGSACHADLHTPSAALKNMGLSDMEALSSVRISLGKDNTEEEIREATALIVQEFHELRRKHLTSSGGHSISSSSP
jgi:cysteine desulfurase